MFLASFVGIISYCSKKPLTDLIRIGYASMLRPAVGIATGVVQTVADNGFATPLPGDFAFGRMIEEGKVAILSRY